MQLLVVLRALTLLSITILESEHTTTTSAEETLLLFFELTFIFLSFFLSQSERIENRIKAHNEISNSLDNVFTINPII